MKLLQEKYNGDAWKVLVYSLFLKRTTRKQVESILDVFFLEYPDPQSFLRASTNRVHRLIKPLGLYDKRALELKDLATELVNDRLQTREDILSIKGCGKYVADCFDIFVLHRDANPTDKQLKKYLKKT